MAQPNGSSLAPADTKSDKGYYGKPGPSTHGFDGTPWTPPSTGTESGIEIVDHPSSHHDTCNSDDESIVIHSASDPDFPIILDEPEVNTDRPIPDPSHPVLHADTGATGPQIDETAYQSHPHRQTSQGGFKQAQYPSQVPGIYHGVSVHSPSPSTKESDDGYASGSSYEQKSGQASHNGNPIASSTDGKANPQPPTSHRGGKQSPADEYRQALATEQMCMQHQRTHRGPDVLDVFCTPQQRTPFHGPDPAMEGSKGEREQSTPALMDSPHANTSNRVANPQPISLSPGGRETAKTVCGPWPPTAPEPSALPLPRFILAEREPARRVAERAEKTCDNLREEMDYVSEISENTETKVRQMKHDSTANDRFLQEWLAKYTEKYLAKMNLDSAPNNSLRVFQDRIAKKSAETTEKSLARMNQDAAAKQTAPEKRSTPKEGEQLNTPCSHKLSTGCLLPWIPDCCACREKYPSSRTYMYKNGVGIVQQGTRWQKYCCACRVHWGGPEKYDPAKHYENAAREKLEDSVKQTGGVSRLISRFVELEMDLKNAQIRESALRNTLEAEKEAARARESSLHARLIQCCFELEMGLHNAQDRESALRNTLEAEKEAARARESSLHARRLGLEAKFMLMDGELAQREQRLKELEAKVAQL